MIVSAHQPLFIPWLGFFNKYVASDKFVMVDNVQFPRKEFVNRNLILGPNGPYWITVPVDSQNHRTLLIRDTEISHSYSPLKTAKALMAPYVKAEFSHEVEVIAGLIANFDGKYLIDLNILLFNQFCDLLNIPKKYLLASELNVQGHKSEYVLDLCLKTNADSYLFGSQGRKYVDKQSFLESNITVKFQDFKRVPADFYTHDGRALGVVHALSSVGGKNLAKLIAISPGDFDE